MNKNLTEPHDNVTYKFGPYQLDLNERMLTRDGETIALAPKVTDILIMLVTNAGQLVEKDELLKRVWPDTFVEEANLSQNIFMLRKALGDDRAEPKYIDTVMRRGYRFIGAVNVVDPDQPGEDSAAAEAAAASRPVVAVLPFTNATGDPEWEYLADGLTDNLINNLSRVSKLRVMSQSAAFRYKTRDVDPRQVGREMHAQAVLVGKVNLWRSGIGIVVELVDSATGWQLWGQSFDSETKDLLEIQDTITRQLLAALKLKLTGEEEKRVTVRYTENAEAYQSYLAGRYHWSRYTRRGIEKAIKHFRDAIELDSNYALAYAAIVDCYLRLATNYLPPEDDLPRSALESRLQGAPKASERIKLRFEWDWCSVEREMRRANELKVSYPSPRQWFVAYTLSKKLYREALGRKRLNASLNPKIELHSNLTKQIASVQLTPTEEVQILCYIARDQMGIGNFEAANLILRRWSTVGKWPRLDALNAYGAADLLFTLGTLMGCMAGTKQMFHGHKYGEAFLNGSVALFEQLGTRSRSAEARVELARCYYKQGLFDIARETISSAYSELSDDEVETKSFCLVIWGEIERDSGRLRDSLTKLREAITLGVAEPFVRSRCYLDLATTLKELAISEEEEGYFNESKLFFLKALHESESVGHHRNVAGSENNMGFLLLSLELYDKSEEHLLRARKLFENFSDAVRGAQVKETLARLYLKTKRLALAHQVIDEAVATLELTDSEAFLAEALTTAGIVAAKQLRFADARKSFEAAYKVAERCGNNEGAGRALLAMFEEMNDSIDKEECNQIADKLHQLFAGTQHKGLGVRLQKCVDEAARTSGKRKDD
jgi:TolB-like protein